MGKPSAPKPPDPKATAAAQTGTNVTTAIANRTMNNTRQEGPNGAIDYSVSGYETITDPATGLEYKVPRYTQTTTLSPEQQRLQDIGEDTSIGLANLANAQTDRISEALATPFGLEGLPDVAYGRGARSRAESAIMDRLQPQLDRDRGRLETRLANQGIKIGSDAYGDAMDDFGRQENDATLAAILSAGSEADRIYSQTMGARQQGLDERFATRNQPINEISALTSGSQVSMPRFGAAPGSSIPTTDFAGLTAENFRQRQANYGQRMGARNALIGGLFGLGSAGIRAIPTGG